MKIRFQKSYFMLALLLFITEVLIALFMHDRFVRPYVGDFLVVMLVYCFVKSFVQAPTLPIAIFTLLFAYVVELLQYYKLVTLLGLQHSALATTVIGSSFEWMDILAYTLGVLVIIWIEHKRRHNNFLKVS